MNLSKTIVLEIRNEYTKRILFSIVPIMKEREFAMNPLVTFVKKVPLIEQIAIGLVIGIVLAVFVPSAVPFVSIFGDLFVSALKGVAPVLVFILVMNAMMQRKSDGDTSMKPIVTLYILGTFAASLVGVTLSFLFPVTLELSIGNSEINPPSGIAQVLHTLIMNVVDNPVNALLRANYIGILAWAVIIGLAMHAVAKEETKKVFDDLSKGITIVVSWVIRFAPIGIMGLVTQSISASGLSALLSYVKLLGVLIASYALVALVMNPLIVFAKIHRNPYPLVLATIRESGIYAFFTRSSAANIPVNLSFANAWVSTRIPIPFPFLLVPQSIWQELRSRFPSLHWPQPTP